METPPFGMPPLYCITYADVNSILKEDISISVLHAVDWECCIGKKWYNVKEYSLKIEVFQRMETSLEEGYVNLLLYRIIKITDRNQCEI
jgi:hypothetical protein